ncbi:MAG: NAD-dependent epimerase/dehydratase family protein [Candidatus Nanopelagicales bacterium]
MRVVITGAAGFIGGHLAHALNADHEVLGIDNCRSGDWGRVPQGVIRDDRDITDPEASEWAELLAGTDVLFHLAAEKYNSSRSTPQRVIDTNISATARLLEGAGRAGVGQVVFTSSLYAYGSLGPERMREDQVLTPTTYYGMSKAAGEHLLRVAERDHGLRWSCARLFFVYGPRQHAGGGYKSVIMTNFERMLNGERPIVKGSGDQRLDYVNIRDVVEALTRLADAKHSGLTVNIGSGQAPRIKDLVDAMQRIAGDVTDPITAPADWTEGSIRCADIDLAHRRLAWTAETRLEQGLAEIWEWLRSQ